MGNSSLILAFVAFLFFTYSSRTSSRSILETQETQSEYEEQVLAREIANSWKNVEIANLISDFDANRRSTFDASYKGGYYDITITEAAGDTVYLIVNGFNGDAGYQITAKLVASSSSEQIPAFLASAIAVGGNIDFDADVDINSDGLNNANIRGNQNVNINKGTASVEGFGWHYDDLKLDTGQRDIDIFQPLSNPMGDPVTEQKPKLDIPLIGTSDFKDSATQTTSQNLYLSGKVALGTKDNPMIWYVAENMTTTGDIEFSGYGIFLVAGNIEFFHNTSMSESGGSVMFVGDQNIHVKAPVELTGSLLANQNIQMDAEVTLNGSLTTNDNWKVTEPLTINYQPPSASITDPLWDGDTTVQTNGTGVGVQVVSFEEYVIEGRSVLKSSERATVLKSDPFVTATL